MCTRSYRKAIDDMSIGLPFDKQNLKDLLALSNRSYTTGFYTRNPREHGENFTDGRSKELTHKAVGTFIQYDKYNGLLSFECKNRLSIGTTIEIISPNDIDTITISEIRNEKNVKVDICHGGSGRFSIPYKDDPGEFSIIRRPLYEQELKSIVGV